MKNNYIEAGDNDLCLSRARQWIFSTLCTIWSLLQLFNRALKYVMQEHTTEVRNVYVHSYSWGLQPLFSVIDRMNRLKNQQRYRRLNTAHHLDLIDIYRTFHWAVHCFSITRGMLTKWAHSGASKAGWSFKTQINVIHHISKLS